MKNNFHKSETNVLSCNEIRNHIQSINLISAWQREKTVKQEMQTKNFVKSDFTSCCKSV